MSSDLDVRELLRTDPAPAMHVDLDAVVAEGRRRSRRHTARWVVAGSAVAAAAVVAVVVVLSPTPEGTSTPPAGTTSTTVPSTGGSPTESLPARAVGLSGSTTLTAADGSYAVSVADGVMSVTVKDGGATGSPVKAVLMAGGGTWRMVDGTGGHRVIVGVAPAGAERITYLPTSGAKVLPHDVKTAAAGDFTAYLMTFREPPSTEMVATDVSWTYPGGATSWSLAVEGWQPDQVGFGIGMDGEAATPLAPDGLTVTGPSATTGAPTEVVFSIVIPSPRLGTPVQAQLQGDVAVVDPARLMTEVRGADPETALAYSTFQVRGGPSVLWGLLPPGATAVTPHLEGGARAGVPVLQSTSSGWTAFAVMVDGTAEQVTGLDATLGNGRGGIGVIQ
ncbi:MAG: hypothetical protein ABIO48_10865 [Pedococcus sp.]